MAIVSMLWLADALGGSYVVQDDARQHVFWMAQYVDSELFRGDLIADYFRSYAPPGYVLLYRALIELGLDPILISKLLPVPLLAAGALLSYRLVLAVAGVPEAAAVSSAILTLSCAQESDVVSGTPRAFVYVLLLLCLYGMVVRRPVIVTVGLALAVAFYPPVAPLVGVAIALLIARSLIPHWRRLGPLGRVVAALAGAALVVLGSIAALAVIRDSIAGNYGPLVSARDARRMVEFGQEGRNSFFYYYWHDRWLTGARSGAFPALLPAQVVGALGFVLLMGWKERWPLAQRWKDPSHALAALLVASAALFLLAHVLLFDLYLPSRYTIHTLRVLTALVSGFALVVVLERIRAHRPGLAIGAAIAATAFVLVTTFTGRYPGDIYEQGKAASVYQAVARRAPDTLTASISGEASNLPSFAKRPVLASPEYALAYHTRYYRQIARRLDATIKAQYAPDAGPLRALASTYGVDLLLVDDDAFSPTYLEQRPWLGAYPSTARAPTQLQQGSRRPFVASLGPRCSIAAQAGVRLIDVRCALDHRASSPR